VLFQLVKDDYTQARSSDSLRARIDSFLVLRTAQEVVWDAKFREEDPGVSSSELAEILSALLRSPWKPSDVTLKELADDYEAYLSEERETWGASWIPEVVYTPVDNLELKLGALVLCGKGEDIFSQLREWKRVRDRTYVWKGEVPE